MELYVKKDMLEAAVLKFNVKVQEEVGSFDYADILLKTAKSIASIVLDGKLSIYGTCLYTEVLELAKKANNEVTYIAVLLQHCVKYGEDLDFTQEYLKRYVAFPLVIQQQVEAQLQKKNESWVDYIARLSQHYLAAKAVMVELIHNSDITKYNYPTKSEHIYCARNLERAMILKTNPSVRSNILLEPMWVVQAMSRVAPMSVRSAIDHHPDNKETHGLTTYWFTYSGGYHPVGRVTIFKPVEKAGGIQSKLSVKFEKQHLYPFTENKDFEIPLMFGTMEGFTEFSDSVEKFMTKEISGMRSYN